MDKMRILGGTPLKGEVEVSGSKNAALPILISSLLTADTCKFRRVPNLMDIRTTLKVLAHMGVEVSTPTKAHEVQLRAANVGSQEAPYDLVRTMRASVVVL